MRASFKPKDAFFVIGKNMSEIDIITSKQFETLFKEMHTQLFYLAYDILGEAQAAQDVVSDVFLSIWNQHRDISPDKVRGYIFVSTKNKALDKYRQSSRYSEIPIEEMKNLMDVCDASCEMREERILWVEKVLQQMPEKTRLILDLCYRKRKSYKEAAEIVGISVEGIKKQLFRALKELRTKLKKEGFLSPLSLFLRLFIRPLEKLESCRRENFRQTSFIIVFHTYIIIRYHGQRKQYEA